MNAGRVEMLRHPRRQPGLHRAGRSRTSPTALEKVPLRVHLGLYDDETAALCHWHVPATHYLEAWSDARALRRHRDDRAAADRAALQRPVGARGARALFSAQPERTGLRRRQASTGRRSRRPRASTSRSSGAARCTTASIAGTAPPREDASARRGAAPAAAAGDAGARLEDRLPRRPDDLRRPLREQRLAAGAAEAAHEADVGQRRARSRRRRPRSSSVDNERRRRARAAGAARSTRAGVGAARSRRRCGHGVTSATAAARAGRVGNGIGFDAYALRTSDAPVVRDAAPRSARPARRMLLASTQDHHSMEGRAIVRVGARSRSSRTTRRSRTHARGDAAARRSTLYADHEYHGLRVGHGDRPDTSAPAATPASSPAWPRTTSRSSARSRCCAAARCTGSASTATTRATRATRTSTTSRCRASSARTRRARWSARWRRRCTAAKA